MTDGTMSSQEAIIARLERLPIAGWHMRMRLIVGTATFFDAFDALTIAFVLPALIGLWHITPDKIGLLIASGYAGQLIGAIVLGWAAERYGRLHALSWCIIILALMSLACAFAWNYESLFFLRFLQGLGLGGQVPIAATYINEFAKAKQRGRFVLIYQCIFPVGIVAATLLGIWVVPTFGWQWMFVIGAIPAFIVVLLYAHLPESPRWLASKGRLEDADRALKSIEDDVSAHGKRSLPPPQAVAHVAPIRARFSELFQGIYLRRTLAVWVMWFCAAFVGYGITTWLPSIYTSVFHLPLQQALTYSLISNCALILGTLSCAYMVDLTGRRFAFTVGFLFAGVPLFVLWWMGAGVTVTAVAIGATICSAFFSFLQLGLYLYTPEIYPTRMRALGCGIASAWTRVGSIAGPTLAGMILASAHISGVFLMLGIIAIIGALAILLFAVETRGKVLEEISP
jgi:putative MFS transporter